MSKIKITVPKPCHENWDKMTSMEKGKFCTSCQKTVIDFSSMSDRQLAAFFKKPAASVCGHFSSDQLNRTIDLSATRKRIPWLRYFFQISLPAFLVSLKASSQSRSPADSVACHQVTIGKLMIREAPGADSAVHKISGVVKDEAGNPMPYVHIKIRGMETAINSGADGRFELPLSTDSAVLEISSVGYFRQEIKVTKASPSLVVVMMPSIMGDTVLVPVKKHTKIPLMKPVMDTAFRNFSVYPNPARPGAQVLLDLNRQEPGYYTISVIDMNGEVIQTEEHQVEKKNKKIHLQMPEAVAGAYYIHLFNRKTAASFTEKIIVNE